MQKSTPLILVLILGVTALYLSLRSKPERPEAGPPPPATAPANPQSENQPATAPTGEDPAVVVPPVAKTPARPWPQAASDITADPVATYGALDNGLRYVIYPNNEPPKRMSMRLHIAAGSLMEADDQQGVAHFLEHMVFNGSKNYSAAELIPRMQRMGIAFGAHVNAYTSFDETVYMLDLPDLSEETQQLGFTVMRDFGDGALLQPAEIDNERGVILAEKISRDSVDYRLMLQQFRTLLPGSLITDRFPIGTEEVIKAAPRERFVDLYTRYYVPARMTFIVVGDVDPAQIAERIEQQFGSMKNPENAGENPDMRPLKTPEGLETAVFSDKEVSSTSLSLSAIKPYVRKPDTAANRLAEMPLDIAHSMVSRRFERLAKKEKSPILSGSANSSDLFNYARIGSLDVTAADGRWQDAVPVLEQEFRRAFEHGFTEAELAEAKANILTSYEQAVKQESTRKSDGIAMALVKSINSETVFSTPETNLGIVKTGLDALTAATCHEAFRKFWEVAGMHLVLTTNSQPEDAEKELSALYQESTGVPVTAPEVTKQQEFAYQSFGKPGTVVSRKEVEDMGITQLVLSNNVRINLKPTDFEKSRIQLSARIGSGQLTQPKDSPMLETFATAVFEGGGLGKHSNEDLEQILAGKLVGSSLGIDEDAFTLGGSTTPTDFGLQVRLMCAGLTDPGYRNEGLWQFQKAIPIIFQQLKHSPAGPQMEMKGWLHGGDARYSPASMEKLAAYTIDDAKEWLTPELSKGYLELSIVGDFQIDEVLPELLATFGALPKRDKTKPELASARKVVLPNAPAKKAFTYESTIPQAVALVIWKTAGIRGHQEEFRRLNLLAEIYQDRLREEIREKLGASYSPNGAVNGSEALDDFGFILGQSVGKTDDVDLLLKTMRDLGDKVATAGVSADDLDRVLKPMLKMIEKSQRDNKYWLGTVMARCQTDPERIELIRGRDADLKSITAKELSVLAKKYMKAENALMVALKPKEE